MTNSSGEFMNTLTGFEEIAVKQMAGASIDAMLKEGEVSRMTRGLAAVKYMRENTKLTMVEAHGMAQKLSRTELAALFRDDSEDEALDEAAGEPVTEAGKDEPTTDEPPMSSPSSASEPA